MFTVADVLRIAAIDAGHELGVFDALVEPLTLAELAVCANVRPTHRFAALVDALVALGVLERIDEGRVAYSRVPDPSERPLVDGWGAIARVIRTDIPLAIDDPEI
ncbi:MAG: hypothetical protein ACKV2T_21020, partial [Kofleriaceae bacterium]